MISCSRPSHRNTKIIRATCTTFLEVKNDVLASITEPRNDDYDKDGSNNYDYNCGNFDDFGVKNDQNVYRT